jgi:YjbE family integral membrane protein
MDTIEFGMALIQIVWINILLSGDNAMVIALACRSLPERQRRAGVVLGAAAAVVLRILFTAGIAQMLEVPYLKAAGALLLLWIAVKLCLTEDEDPTVAAHERLWRAVWTVVVADMVMSLDNVVAIAGAARGSVPLIGFGLALSIPLIVFGATLIVTLLNRFPILVWAGAALLGWIAGEMVMDDRAVLSWGVPASATYFVAAAAAALVPALGWALRSRGRAAPASEPGDS